MPAPRDTPPDLRLRDLANDQWGILHHDHLALTRAQVATRLDAGRLTRLHDEVYAFGHSVLRDEGTWLAAQWACGPEAVLSHLTAARFHGWPLPVGTDDDVHLSTTGNRRSREGIAVHRVRRLDAIDVHRPHPLAVTTIPRTLVDLADVLAWSEYRALADAQPRLDLRALRAAQSRAPGRRGRGLVTRLVEADDAHTRSEFERRFLRFCSAHGIPRPDGLNERLAGHRADAIYRARKLVVELDGRAFHVRRANFRADRARDVDYQLAGYLIMRIVWDDLHPETARTTADRFRRMLGVSRGDGYTGTR